ncbi:PfkB family carbohydrate kinase [Oscillospiraceae bacterium PP1C4]
MIKALGIGDNVVDKYMHISTMYPGGNALNFAAYAKLFGAETGYMGSFGDDEAAKHVYSVMQELKIDLTHCRFCKGENGYAEVKLESGDRVFIGSNQGGINKNNPMVISELDSEYIKGYDIVHTSIFSYIEEQLPVIRKCAGFISMDFSDRYTEEYLKRCAQYIDCACLSCSDMKDEDIVDLMKLVVQFGCKHIVIATRGARGALVMVDGKLYEQSPCLVKAKDTMGAGDSFITCFLINYVGLMKDAVGFSKESGDKGITTISEYQDSVVKVSLYKAAVFSAENCQKDGAFGHGKQF